MKDPSEQSREYVNRRRFIELAGASGALALAGCSSEDNSGSGNGSGGNGNGGNSSSGGSSVKDATFYGRANQVPTKIQWNPSNPSSERLDPHEVVSLLADGVGERGKQAAAFGGWSPTPAVEGRPCGRDRTVDVFFSTCRDLREALFGRRIQGLDPLAVRGGNELAVDQLIIPRFVEHAPPDAIEGVTVSAAR